MSDKQTERSDSLPEALSALNGIDPGADPVGVILGSGLGALADAVVDANSIPTTQIPGYAQSTVEGHRGELVFGSLAAKNVIIVRGRLHYYEGHSIQQVVFPIRLMHALGARRLIVTNAAGGINSAFRPGTLMFIRDHINFAFANPLIGPNTDEGPRFPDMSEPYDRAWMAAAKAAADKLGIATQEGVYLWTTGPSYETRAEIKAMRTLGADAVGMSTVPEVIKARHLGMKVLGLSTITNLAAGLTENLLNHDEVLEVGRLVRDQLVQLITRIVAET